MRYKVKPGDLVIVDEGLVEFEIDIERDPVGNSRIVINIHRAALEMEVTAGHQVTVTARER